MERFIMYIKNNPIIPYRPNRFFLLVFQFTSLTFLHISKRTPKKYRKK